MCALTNNDRSNISKNNGLGTPPSVTSITLRSKSKENLSAVSQPTCSSKILEPTNSNTPKDLDKSFLFSEKGLKKRTHDSLSSSENSISSACDDPTEIEADILKATHSLEEEEGDDNQQEPDTVSDLKSKPSQLGAMDEKENIVSAVGIDVADMPATTLKINYKFTNTETKLLRKILTSHGLREAEENQSYNLLWTGVHIKPDILRNLAPYQRVNHFPR